MFHVGGINIQTLPTFLCGGTVVLVPQFDPDSFFDIMEKGGITQVTVVPAILSALIADERWKDFRPETLACMAIGSTDVPVLLIEAVHAKGIPMVQVYGATETGPVTIYQPIDEAFDTVGSIGRCGLHSRVRLVGPDGEDVKVGESGEIWVNAPNCFSGYWHDEEATCGSVVDGWFRTGDVAMRDADGLYWFRDRMKNVIISGGENIYPAEVERVLRQVEGVAECCVVGRPDQRWGQVPVAVLATAGDTIPAERLRSAMEGNLARFKQPKDFVQIAELPRNAMGKIAIDSVRDIVLRQRDR
jgi:fatty-acyl-CoA synthase